MIHEFCFFSYRTAIRYHLANQLLKRGWVRTDREKEAVFSDRNLTLNDDISVHLEYKHLLAALLKKHHIEVMPLSYSINDNNFQQIIAEIIYRHYWQKGRYDSASKIKWILKPSTLNNGDYIHLFNHIEGVKKHYENPHRMGGEHILQQYIDQPDLLEGKKYTFRIHVIITNYAGVWVSRHGYVNMSPVIFDPNEPLLLKKMHITNYVLNGELSYITQRPTWELQDFSVTYEKMKNVIKRVILALTKEYAGYLRPSTDKCFEIFGFDFMLDSAKQLWLLEINQGPDAPMYEDNKMKEIFWLDFWNGVVEQFVLPIAKAEQRVDSYAENKQFKQLLTASECYSPWRYWLSRLIDSNRLLYR